MSFTVDMPMRELRFSARKLLKLAAGGTLIGFGAIIIPLDRDIATGHAGGLWNSLLYDIGPTGRWAFALACIGFSLFCVLRLTMVAAGDRIALRSGESGVFVRTISKQREVPWRDVVVIDMSTTTVRRRTRRSVRVRIKDDDGEKSLHVPLSLLDASDEAVAFWIAGARNIQASRKDAKATSARPGFGRRMTFTAS